MPKPNPRVSGVKLGLVLFGMHAADALGLLRGASGPFMGHCAMKIEKITTILISALDLRKSARSPPGIPKILVPTDSWGPGLSFDVQFSCIPGGHARVPKSRPFDIQCRF